MADYLKPLAIADVAAWYYRLADSIAKNKVENSEPLASVFLRHWLDNRQKDSLYSFNPPAYLQQHPKVKEVLQYHRDVFLTKQKGRTNKTEKWMGILPRLQGDTGYTRWQGNGILTMSYESLCDIAPNVMAIIKIQSSGSAADRDLMTALRGFQLESNVTLTGKPSANNKIQINFTTWKCVVRDTYDWNYNEYFTVPNPDFGSKAENAVRPGDQSLKVFHSNAKRLEDAGLAAPYKIESSAWSVSDAALMAAETIDPNRKF